MGCTISCSLISSDLMKHALQITAWLAVALISTAARGQTPTSEKPPSNSNAGGPAKPWPEGMVWIPGGEFWMGSDEPEFADARPWHRVYVDGFWMDKTELTNEQFEKFVKATGYVTIAEKTPRAEDFPGAPPENLVAGSVVFSPPSEPVPLDNFLRWWNYVKGADWRHPAGPGTDLKGKEKHP